MKTHNEAGINLTTSLASLLCGGEFPLYVPTPLHSVCTGRETREGFTACLGVVANRKILANSGN
jgi:hypothetical protein